VSDLRRFACKFTGTFRVLLVVQDTRKNLAFGIRCIGLLFVFATAVIQNQITAPVVMDRAVKLRIFGLEVDATDGGGRFGVAVGAPVDVLDSQFVVLQVDGPAPLEAKISDCATVAGCDFVVSLVPAGEGAGVLAVALRHGHRVRHCDGGSGQGEEECGLRMHLECLDGIDSFVRG
jgi:hypothetical protein